MATKKAPVRASRAAPARAPSTPKLAATPPAPVPDGTVVLAHHGGATLSFRDGSGAKRRVLRGVPFVVDSATAEVLLTTDPSISVAEAEDAPVPVTTSVTTPVEPAPDMSGQVQTPAAESIAPAPPAAAPSAPGPGAITLGDLPPSAKIGGQ